jgi:hypothetical protein
MYPHSANFILQAKTSEKNFSMLSSIFLTSFTLLAAASAEQCTRESLKCATDAYLTAQSIGSSDLLAPFIGHDLTYTENDLPLNIKTGILSQALKIDHNMSIYDTIACSTFTEVIVSNPEKPYVIVTRMVWDGRGDQIGTIESIVTTTGDWLFK